MRNPFNFISHLIDLIAKKAKNKKESKLIDKIIESVNFKDLNAFLNDGYQLSKSQKERLYKVNNNSFLLKFKHDNAKNYLLDFVNDGVTIHNPECLVAPIMVFFDCFDFHYYHFHNRELYENSIKSSYFNHEKYKISLEKKYSNNMDNKFIYYSLGEANFFTENKKLLLFINKFINENKDAFITGVMEIINNYPDQVPMYFMNNFHRFIEEIYPLLSDDVKATVVSTYITYERKKSMPFEKAAKKFIQENNHLYKKSMVISNYDKSVFKKNKTEFKNFIVESETNTANEDIKKTLAKKEVTKEIRDLYSTISQNYKRLLENKNSINIESMLVIKNIVNNKLIIILNNYVTACELNNALNINDGFNVNETEEHKLCVKSLTGINNMIAKELHVLRSSNLEQLEVLNNYIHAER